jgi:hypothetical protein
MSFISTLNEFSVLKTEAELNWLRGTESEVSLIGQTNSSKTKAVNS